MSLTYTFQNIYQEVSNFLGLGLNPSGVNLTLVKKYANEGYRRFILGLDPRTGLTHEWSFLSPINTLVAYSSGFTSAGTGTYSLPSTTIVLTSTVYNSMRLKYLTAGGTAYQIISVVEPHTLVVTGDCHTQTSFTLPDPGGKYTLPSDFGGIMMPFNFRGLPYSALKERTTAEIMQLASYTQASGLPSEFSVEIISGNDYEVQMFPKAAGDWTFDYRYRVEPSSLINDTDVPLGGYYHSSTILASALAIAQLRHDDSTSIHQAEYEKLMIASINLDLKYKTSNIGYNRDNSIAPAGPFNRRIPYSASNIDN